MQGEGWELPDGVQPWSTFHWFKVGAKRPLELVILSDVPHWYIGHFYEKRMWPCSAPGCPTCEDGIGKQIRFCFAMVDVETRRVGLIEVSDSIGQLIRAWVPRNEGLRGMHLLFSRHSLSIKSRMEVEFLEQEVVGWWRDLEVPDPKIALELTWTKMRAGKPAMQTRTAEDFRRGVRG
jgi:hypothetical protein